MVFHSDFSYKRIEVNWISFSSLYMSTEHRAFLKHITYKYCMFSAGRLNRNLMLWYFKRNSLISWALTDESWRSDSFFIAKLGHPLLGSKLTTHGELIFYRVVGLQKAQMLKRTSHAKNHLLNATLYRRWYHHLKWLMLLRSTLAKA